MLETITTPLSALCPDMRKFLLIFEDPKIQPPNYELMKDDINRLAESISKTYTDKTCAPLNFEDLKQECFVKLSKNLSKIESLPNRYEAFKYIKTIFNNHIKSLVGKHRLTRKRGYLGRQGDTEYVKNVDVSIDNEEAGIQIAAPDDDNIDQSLENYKPFLSSIELLVLRELSCPSESTLLYAQIDSFLGKEVNGSEVKLVVKRHHIAKGLGLSLDEFKNIMTNLELKIKFINMHETSDTELKWNRSLMVLEECFNLQIPRSIPKMVVIRLLTLAARDQYSKVQESEEIQIALREVGAKVPEYTGGTLTCHGVLYQKNHRVCNACGLKESCATEAHNYGLGDITISPRLLGTKQVRIPVVLPNSDESSADSFITSKDEEEIYNFLRETFKVAKYRNDLYFRHKGIPTSNQFAQIILIETRPKFELRFLKPSDSLQAKLEKHGNGTHNKFYAPTGLSVDKVMELIEEHSKETLVKATTGVV